jgi:hypothetical protein
MRNILIILALAAALLIGIFATKYYYSAREYKSEEQSQVLLEKIKNVCKLVTVEGQFSEVYNYSDYWGYDFSPFRKKALIRIKAKVSAGYDLGKMKITAVPESKIIRIADIPEPSILSIDHDLDYYDITEGSFNSFSASDYTKLNEKAKKFVEAQAQKSPLLESAKKQGIQMLDVIKIMIESAGWKVEIINTPNATIAN